MNPSIIGQRHTLHVNTTTACPATEDLHAQRVALTRSYRRWVEGTFPAVPVSLMEASPCIPQFKKRRIHSGTLDPTNHLTKLVSIQWPFKEESEFVFGGLGVNQSQQNPSKPPSTKRHCTYATVVLGLLPDQRRTADDLRSNDTSSTLCSIIFQWDLGNAKI